MEKVFTIVSCNTFWSILLGRITLFNNGISPDCTCLQEVIESRLFKKSKSLLNYPHKKSIKLPSDFGLKMYNFTFSKKEIADNGVMIFDNTAKLVEATDDSHKSILRNCVLWSIIPHEDTHIKVYNCHLQIRGLGPLERKTILEYLMADSEKFSGPVVICGDMNTAIPKPSLYRKIIQIYHKCPKPSLFIDGKFMDFDERHIFHETAKKNGFTDALDIDVNTWCFPFTQYEALGRMKLDWILYKGFKRSEYKVGKYMGDHRPVLAKLYY